jgi:hypothetical protein
MPTEIATAPGAAAPATTTPPDTPGNPPEPKSHEQRMMDSIRKVVGPAPGDPPVVPPAPEEAEVSDKGDPRTFSQFAEAEALRIKEGRPVQARPGKEVTPEAQVPPPEQPAPAAPTLTQPLPRIRPRQAPVMAPPAPPPAPVIVPPVAAPTPPADPDAAFVAGLDDEQKDEIALAEFAEKAKPELVGQRKKVLEFYKAVASFKAANPGKEDELEAFVKDHAPNYAPGQKRKLERQQLIEEAEARATEKVRAELAPQQQAQEQRLRKQELAPLMEQARGQFDALMTSAESVPEASMSSLPKEVVESVRRNGLAKAIEEYPVEAPIAYKYSNAADVWMGITTGSEPFNPAANPMHAWVDRFVKDQGRFYASRPEAETVAEDGRRFLPYLEFHALRRSDPNAASAYYTFNDTQVLKMFATAANIEFNDEVKKLERAGFKRAPKNTVPQPENGAQKTTPVPAPNPQPPPTAPAASPRIASTPSPGAGRTNGNGSGRPSFIDKILGTREV